MEFPLDQIIVLSFLSLDSCDHSLDFVDEDRTDSLFAPQFIDDVLALGLVPLPLPLDVVEEQAFLHVLVVATADLLRDVLLVDRIRAFITGLILF